MQAVAVWALDLLVGNPKVEAFMRSQAAGLVKFAETVAKAARSTKAQEAVFGLLHSL